MSNHDLVSSPSLVVQGMREKWKLPLDLMGGTSVMRSKGKEYLPQEPRESDRAYDVRLNRTILYNMFRRTVMSLKGQAFVRPIVVSNVPPELEYMEYNFDGTGRTITDIAADLLEDLLVCGIAYGIVDHPSVPGDVETLADYRDRGYRPYFNHIAPMRLLGWRTTGDLGFPELDQVRVFETSIEEGEEEFSEVIVERVLVYERERVRIFERQQGESEFEVDERDFTLDKVPLVQAYASNEGFMMGSSPLEDLAWMNLVHYQSFSDQRNILHIARVPFILATGFTSDEVEGLEINSNRLISTTSENASMKYVEHTGAAINAGETDLNNLEKRGSTLGADLIMMKSVSRQTATARQIDQSESLSVIQLSLRSLEKMLEDAYALAGEWVGVDATDVSITIGEDLSAPVDPNPVTSLISLAESLGLTKSELIELAKQKNLIPAYYEVELGNDDVVGESGSQQTPLNSEVDINTEIDI